MSSQVLKNNLAIPSVIRHFWPLGPPRGVKEVEYLTLKILFVVRGGSGRQGKWNLHLSRSFSTFFGSGGVEGVWVLGGAGSGGDGWRL